MKRLIGRRFNDPIVQKDIKTLPFKVIERNGKPIVKVYTGLDEKLFTPEEISAMVLGKMRQIAVMFSLLVVDNKIILRCCSRKDTSDTI